MKSKKKLIWDPKDKRFGFMEIRDYPESDLMSVTLDSGLGSLIYANVLMRMPEETFLLAGQTVATHQYSFETFIMIK